VAGAGRRADPPAAGGAAGQPRPEVHDRARAGPRDAAGEKYVNILGAEVARRCLEAGLLDEILVLVAPVLLGDGTRLFDWPGGHSVDLVVRDVTVGPNATSLWYDVVR
jgi:dihydrofolate reductase